jgi:tyrosine phenol-lyase
MDIRLRSGNQIPVEMHKVRIVQEISLPSVDRRLQAIEEAGYNTFLLRTRDIFLDLLTDSGVNAMSDQQQAAMMIADDAYAGSETYYRMCDAVKDVLGYEYALPVHQGRAAEHLINKIYVKPGQVSCTNYHFTTSRAHSELLGSPMLELYAAEALNTQSVHPFKGNMDIGRLEAAVAKHGRDGIAYVRMEATTNLLGGQPFSMENLRAVREVCTKHGLTLILDGSLISENAYLVREREAGYAEKSIAEIYREMCSLVDVYYMSARKSTSVRGGLIATNDPAIFEEFRSWLPVYEGFQSYGGMSLREVEAMSVGMREMTNEDVAGASVRQIRYFAARLIENGIPVVTPAGGLAVHLDAMRFVDHVPQREYTAGALAAAVYLASGIRTMERGTVSMDRDMQGNETLADLELTRVAVPRRVYTVSHLEYAVDRLAWLLENRRLVHGLKFAYEPKVLRFFFGKMTPVDDWAKQLAAACRADFGEY